MQGHCIPSPLTDKLHSEAPSLELSNPGTDSGGRQTGGPTGRPRCVTEPEADASAWGRFRPGARRGCPPPGGRSVPEAQPSCKGGGTACCRCHCIPTREISGVLPPRTLQKASFIFKKGVKQRKAERQRKEKSMVFAYLKTAHAFC